METVFLIFGALIALNIGIGAGMSEPSDVTWDYEPSVTVEAVDPEISSQDNN